MRKVLSIFCFPSELVDVRTSSKVVVNLVSSLCMAQMWHRTLAKRH